MRSLYFFSLSVLWSIGCAAAAQNSATKVPCENVVASVARIERPGTDWSREVIKKPQVLTHSAFEIGPEGEDGLVSIVYAVFKTTIILPHIAINKCDDTAVVSDLYFRPSSALGIERSGHIFAYIVAGQVMSGLKPNAAAIGVVMNVVFYDIHGGGQFDTVQVGSMKRLPFIPKWAK